MTGLIKSVIVNIEIDLRLSELGYSPLNRPIIALVFTLIAVFRDFSIQEKEPSYIS